MNKVPVSKIVTTYLVSKSNRLARNVLLQSISSKIRDHGFVDTTFCGLDRVFTEY